MKKNSRLSKFENIEIHHKIIAFLSIMTATILLTRVIVMIHNPNPALFHFELHHFDYGIAILLINTFLLIFGTQKEATHLMIAAISTGLIADDYWFIRKSVVENDSLQTQIYNATLPSVLVFTGAILITILFINARKIKKAKKMRSMTQESAHE